jgi:hypothetical protein
LREVGIDAPQAQPDESAVRCVLVGDDVEALTFRDLQARDDAKAKFAGRPAAALRRAG